MYKKLVFGILRAATLLAAVLFAAVQPG